MSEDRRRDACATVTDLITALRQQAKPATWDAVGEALRMAPRTVLRYRHLIAADLHARGLGWTEIASQPQVDLSADTLRKEHPKWKLPNGLSWDEHIAAFQESLRIRSEELQAAHGAAFAEQLDALVLGEMEFQKVLQSYRLTFAKNPPQLITLENGNSLACYENHTQITIPFPGEAPPVEVEFPEQPKAKRLTPPFVRYLQSMSREATANWAGLLAIQMRLPERAGDSGDETSGAAATLDELNALRDEARKHLSELDSYLQEADVA